MSKFLLTKTGSLQNIWKIPCHLRRLHAAWIKINYYLREVQYSSPPPGIPDFVQCLQKQIRLQEEKDLWKECTCKSAAYCKLIRPVMRTVPISWKKSVWQDFGFLIPATAVKALASVHFWNYLWSRACSHPGAWKHFRLKKWSLCFRGGNQQA